LSIEFETFGKTFREVKAWFDFKRSSHMDFKKKLY